MHKSVKTSPKKFRLAPSGQLRNKRKKVSKLLIVAAVILFIWLLAKDGTQSSGQQLAGQNSTSSAKQLFGADKQEGNSGISGASVLNGPLATLEQILFNSAHGAIDFSADDIYEDTDLTILQENSLIASNSPSPEEIFSSFKKTILEYIVKSGDTPEGIAIANGINNDTLLWANNLKDGDLIRPGDKLIILPINGIRIKVGSKDTVDSLAKKYQGKSEEIITFNSLPSGGILAAGEYIIIPGGEMPIVKKTIIPQPKSSAPKYAASTQKAGWLIIPTTGRNWGKIHSYNGVDVANDCGTPIYAAAAGKIILSDASGWNGGYGKYVKIQHSNGVVTLYAHASSLLVASGESVGQGQLIAYMGTTGRSTGCHLHFEVRGAANPLAKR